MAALLPVQGNTYLGTQHRSTELEHTVTRSSFFCLGPPRAVAYQLLALSHSPLYPDESEGLHETLLRVFFPLLHCQSCGKLCSVVDHLLSHPRHHCCKVVNQAITCSALRVT